MKNKDIINMIKNESEKVEVPNLSDSILNNYKNKQYFKNETINETKENKYRFGIKPLKILAFVLALFLIVPAALITIDLIDNGDVIDTNPIKLNVSKTKAAVGVQAASLFGFAEQNDGGSIATMSLTDDDYEEMSDELNQYLFSVEELMNRSNNTYELYELKEGDYQYKMTITVNSNGLLSNYTMYFNEQANELDYDDIDEVSSTIEGYIESGSKKYSFIGLKEVEEDECEVELKLYIDEENYIIVEQEIEKNESEYYFKYFKNGKVEKEVEVSTEFEGEDCFIELEVKKDNKHNGYKIKYDDENKMKVQFNYGENSGEFYIDVYEEEYEYTFDNDKKVNHGRPEHSHGNGHWDEEHHPDDNKNHGNSNNENNNLPNDSENKENDKEHSDSGNGNNHNKGNDFEDEVNENDDEIDNNVEHPNRDDEFPNDDEDYDDDRGFEKEK